MQQDKNVNSGKFSMIKKINSKNILNIMISILFIS